MHPLLWISHQHDQVDCVPPLLMSLVFPWATGLGGPPEQRLPPHLQHGAEPAARGGDQPGVHAGEVLLPVPALPGPARRLGE